KKGPEASCYNGIACIVYNTETTIPSVQILTAVVPIIRKEKRRRVDVDIMLTPTCIRVKYAVFRWHDRMRTPRLDGLSFCSEGRSVNRAPAWSKPDSNCVNANVESILTPRWANHLKRAKPNRLVPADQNVWPIRVGPCP